MSLKRYIIFLLIIINIAAAQIKPPSSSISVSNVNLTITSDKQEIGLLYFPTFWHIYNIF